MTSVGAGGSSVGPIDQSLLPAAVRNGSQERKEQYQAALSFERVLVGQLTERLMKGTALGAGDDAPAAVKVMKEQLPSNFADAIMNAGGLGLAQQLDSNWASTGTGTTAAPKSTSLSDITADAPNAANVTTGPGGGVA